MTIQNKMAECQQELAVAQDKISGCWEEMIAEVLQSGPKRIGELIEALGVFNLEATAADAATRYADGLSPFGGSFRDSPAQEALGRMVENGSVVWQRAANMDNWYALLGQAFPKEAAVRDRTVRQFAEEVVSLFSIAEWNGLGGSGFATISIEETLSGISNDDVWAEAGPFMVAMEEDGWSLCDGDCLSSGCLFTEEYPMNVDARTIAEKMKLEAKKLK